MRESYAMEINRDRILKASKKDKKIIDIKFIKQNATTSTKPLIIEDKLDKLMGDMKDLLYKVENDKKYMPSNATLAHFNEVQRLHKKPYNYDWSRRARGNDKQVVPRNSNQGYREKHTHSTLRKHHLNLQKD